MIAQHGTAKDVGKLWMVLMVWRMARGHTGFQTEY
jgi:hypothetical protein